MTGNPGEIHHEIRIETPRGERKDFNLKPLFLEYKQRIVRLLEQ